MDNFKINGYLINSMNTENIVSQKNIPTHDSAV